jgi:regulatory protein
MELSELLDKARYYCSRQEACISVVKEKLVQWGASEEQLEELISTLLEEKFIDEHRYAQAFASDKLRFDHWGKQKIEYILRSKFITNQVIRETLESIDETEYRNTLRNELKKKIPSVRSRSPWETKGKLFRFAASRGFEHQLIYDVLDELLNEE